MHHRDNRGHVVITLPAYSLSHIMCDYDGTDIDTTYRTCCISTSNSSTSLPVPTLFDTDASPSSFVNRHVVAWIESQRGQRTPGKR